MREQRQAEQAAEKAPWLTQGAVCNEFWLVTVMVPPGPERLAWSWQAWLQNRPRAYPSAEASIVNPCAPHTVTWPPSKRACDTLGG